MDKQPQPARDATALRASRGWPTLCLMAALLGSGDDAGAAGFNFSLPKLQDMVAPTAGDSGDGSQKGQTLVSPATCPSDLQAAKATLQSAEQAAASRRWADALAGYDAAESRLNDISAKCYGDEAVEATSIGDTLPAKKDAARQGSQQAQPTEQVQSSACQPASAQAFALDNQAAAEMEKKAWAAAEQLLGQAQAAWAEAVAVCNGNEKNSAARNQDDSARARLRVAARLEDPKACDKAFTDARRMMDLAQAAKAENQPEDAALWQRKSAMAWGVAVTKCSGDRRSEARQQQQAASGEPESPAASPLAGTAVPPAAASAPPSSPQAGPETMPQTSPAAAEPAAPSQLAAVAPGAALPTADSLTVKVGDTTFSGHFRKDASGTSLSGTGQVRWDNGNVYDGALVAGKFQGQGTMVWNNGDRYEGQWDADQPHGQGRLSHANGDQYQGEFVHGEPEGRGQLNYGASGDQYQGQVRAGQPDGQGTYRWRSGDRYDGSWLAGRKHGPGRMTWASGDYWEGEYANGQPTDKGQLVRATKTP